VITAFERVDRFTVGTVGQPGARAFFIQVKAQARLISMSLEKTQVEVLAERLKYMLKEIRLAHPTSYPKSKTRDQLPLDIPVLDSFRIGTIALFFDASSQMIQVDLRENNPDYDEDDVILSIDPEIEVVRVFITAAQAETFSERALLVVSAGRLPCPFCSLPINPDGHLCARANGYRR
jgi:uncharacterized repeat protein (TIGR03847 family)